MKHITEAAYAVEQMERYLKDMFQKSGRKDDMKKLWEHTYISRQIDRRKNGETFSVEDHIRGIVYSLLSSGGSWVKILKDIDEDTGKILPVDDIFHGYDPAWILSCSPEQLESEIRNLHYSCRFLHRQIEALISTNIPKLLTFEKQGGSVDNYYHGMIGDSRKLGTLVRALSKQGSHDKMKQMDAALVSEYLRNVGYDLPKPDRHIRRILGSQCLACSEQETVPESEVFDIITAIFQRLNRSAAEVDYILWAYCADGYGEICKKDNPKCGQCTARKYCVTGQSANEI